MHYEITIIKSHIHQNCIMKHIEQGSMKNHYIRMMINLRLCNVILYKNCTSVDKRLTIGAVTQQWEKRGTLG